MMTLQIYFRVPGHQGDAFRRMYEEAYAPALRKQEGYLSSRLLELFPDDLAAEIEAVPTEFNFQMELTFDTEENRRRWAASEDHAEVWPRAESLAEDVAWRGFFVRGIDPS